MKISKKTRCRKQHRLEFGWPEDIGVFFCLVSLGQAHGDKAKGNGQRTTVHSVTTSNLLVFQKYDQTEKNINIYYEL